MLVRVEFGVLYRAVRGNRTIPNCLAKVFFLCCAILGGGRFFFLVQQCGGVKNFPPHSIRRNFLNVRWEGLVWEAQRISDSLGCFDYDIVLGIGSTRRLVEGQSALSEAWPEGKGNVIIFLDAAWMIYF